LRNSLSAEAIKMVEVAIVNQKMYDDYLDYFSNSVLMKMNAVSVPTATLVFGCTNENVTNVYRELLTSVEMYDFLKEKTGVGSEISELVQLRNKRFDDTVDTVVEVFTNEKEVAFQVEVMHLEEATVQALGDAVEDFVASKQSDVAKAVGAHEIELVSKSTGITYRQEVLKKQRDLVTHLTSLQTSSDNSRGKLSGNAKTYFDYLMSTDGEENEAVMPSAPVPAASVSFTYVAIGMILAAFIEVFVIFVLYIMNQKIRITDKLKEIYSISQLGRVESEKGKRFLGFFDELILKLRYWGERRFTRAEALKLAAVAVKVEAKKEQAQSVYLLGCNLAEAAREVCDYIKDTLEEEKIQVKILNNVLYDAEAMEELLSAGHVVLVETAGVTLYKEVEEVLEVLQRQNITVLGGVVVG